MGRSAEIELAANAEPGFSGDEHLSTVAPETTSDDVDLPTTDAAMESDDIAVWVDVALDDGRNRLTVTDEGVAYNGALTPFEDLTGLTLFRADTGWEDKLVVHLWTARGELRVELPAGIDPLRMDVPPGRPDNQRAGQRRNEAFEATLAVFNTLAHDGLVDRLWTAVAAGERLSIGSMLVERDGLSRRVRLGSSPFVPWERVVGVQRRDNGFVVLVVASSGQAAPFVTVPMAERNTFVLEALIEHGKLVGPTLEPAPDDTRPQGSRVIDIRSARSGAGRRRTPFRAPAPAVPAFDPIAAELHRQLEAPVPVGADAVSPETEERVAAASVAGEHAPVSEPTDDAVQSMPAPSPLVTPAATALAPALPLSDLVSGLRSQFVGLATAAQARDDENRARYGTDGAPTPFEVDKAERGAARSVVSLPTRARPGIAAVTSDDTARDVSNEVAGEPTPEAFAVAAHDGMVVEPELPMGSADDRALVDRNADIGQRAPAPEQVRAAPLGLGDLVSGLRSQFVGLATAAQARDDENRARYGTDGAPTPFEVAKAERAARRSASALPTRARTGAAAVGQVEDEVVSREGPDPSSTPDASAAQDMTPAVAPAAGMTTQVSSHMTPADAPAAETSQVDPWPAAVSFANELPANAPGADLPRRTRNAPVRESAAPITDDAAGDLSASSPNVQDDGADLESIGPPRAAQSPLALGDLVTGLRSQFADLAIAAHARDETNRDRYGADGAPSPFDVAAKSPRVRRGRGALPSRATDVREAVEPTAPPASELVDTSAEATEPASAGITSDPALAAVVAVRAADAPGGVSHPSLPDSSAPDSSLPDSSAPDSSAPDSSTPDVALSEPSLPDSSATATAAETQTAAILGPDSLVAVMRARRAAALGQRSVPADAPGFATTGPKASTSADAAPPDAGPTDSSRASRRAPASDAAATLANLLAGRAAGTTPAAVPTTDADAVMTPSSGADGSVPPDPMVTAAGLPARRRGRAARTVASGTVENTTDASAPLDTTPSDSAMAPKPVANRASVLGAVLSNLQTEIHERDERNAREFENGAFWDDRQAQRTAARQAAKTNPAEVADD